MTRIPKLFFIVLLKNCTQTPVWEVSTGPTGDATLQETFEGLLADNGGIPFSAFYSFVNLLLAPPPFGALADNGLRFLETGKPNIHRVSVIDGVLTVDILGEDGNVLIDPLGRVGNPEFTMHNRFVSFAATGRECCHEEEAL